MCCNPKACTLFHLIQSFPPIFTSQHTWKWWYLQDTQGKTPLSSTKSWGIHMPLQCWKCSSKPNISVTVCRPKKKKKPSRECILSVYSIKLWKCKKQPTSNSKHLSPSSGLGDRELRSGDLGTQSPAFCLSQTALCYTQWIRWVHETHLSQMHNLHDVTELWKASVLLICVLDFRGFGPRPVMEKFWSQEGLGCDASLCPSFSAEHLLQFIVPRIIPALVVTADTLLGRWIRQSYIIIMGKEKLYLKR